MLLFAFPGYEPLAKHIAALSGAYWGEVTIRRYPDEESYVKFHTDVRGEDIALVCSLERPDHKAMALMFFAATAREFGAKSIGLIAPYLGYMRQDKRFQEGEAVTSAIFAAFLSQHVDWLVTMEPHLHRYHSLEEIYRIPVQVVHATSAIAEWIKHNVKIPLLIGPDEESEQWVSAIATQVNAPYLVLCKIRHGDKNVEIKVPSLEAYMHHTPILLDDIISTARTMINTIQHLKTAGMQPPVCIGVHAIFAENSYELLQKSGAQQIVTCNTIPHPSNGIEISEIFAVSLDQ